MTDFDEIYREHFTDVYKYLLTLCKNEAQAEEITQEAFVKAIKNIESFKGECSLFVWLCQIAKNTYFSAYKRERCFVSDAELEIAESETDLPEELLIRSDTVWQIHKILHELQEPYREVFSLRIFSELSFSQIADLFGKTESWARVTYHRAKLKIREELK